MKPIRLFFDLLLLIAILATLYFFFIRQKSTPNSWENPFQTFPWKQLKKVESNHKQYSIQVVGEQLTLISKNKKFNLSWSTFQKYMDNILILPEYKYFEQKDSDAAYGLNQNSITFHFATKTHVLRLGKRLAGDSSKFYLSLDNKLFTLPSVLRQNIDWPLTSFIDTSPFNNQLQTLTLLNVSFQKSKLIIQKNKNQYSATNSRYPLKPYNALQKLFTMKGEVDLSPSMSDESCTDFAQSSKRLIQKCGNYFYSPKEQVTWKLDKNTINHMQNFDLKLISKQLSDFIHISLDKVGSIQFPNGLILSKKDKSFLYIMKLLNQSQISFEQNSILEAETLTLVTPNNSFQLRGQVTNERFFKFKISEYLTGVLPFTKFQSIYQ